MKKSSMLPILFLPLLTVNKEQNASKAYNSMRIEDIEEIVDILKRLKVMSTNIQCGKQNSSRRHRNIRSIQKNSNQQHDFIGSLINFLNRLNEE